ARAVDLCVVQVVFFFSSRRRHTRLVSDWSSDVCSSDLMDATELLPMDQQIYSRRCKARSKRSRQRCRRLAIPGGVVCTMHGGAEIGRASCREREESGVGGVVGRVRADFGPGDSWERRAW